MTQQIEQNEEQLADVKKIYTAGCAAKEAGEHQKAFDLFLEGSTKYPGVVAMRLNLSLSAVELAKQKNDMLDLAFYNTQEVCRIAPDTAGHWFVFGEISLECNKFPEAAAAFEKALAIMPEHGFMWAMLGFAYNRWGKLVEARDAFEMAVKLDPELGMPHAMLASLYYSDFFNPAKTAYHGEMGFTAKKASKIQLESMWTSAHGFLHMGNYVKGWTYFEARLRRNATNTGQQLTLERYAKPLWRGEKNKRVLVQTEMGLGDAFIMVRYLGMIKRKYDCDVQFECHASMIDLIQVNFPDVKCVPYGTVDVESFDFQIPIMSLPLVFETKTFNVPWFGPYIAAEEAKIAEWREKLQLSPDKLNVGICWFSGRNSWSADNHFTSKRKSLEFHQIKPLLAIEGINFVSLQTERDEQFKNPGIKTFSDTAAIMHLMDVVVAVDTAVANLAGAMDAQLFLMDRYDHCWRWCDIQSPWFPSAKAYRQGEERQWEPVVEKIKGDLIKMRDTMRASTEPPNERAQA